MLRSHEKGQRSMQQYLPIPQAIDLAQLPSLLLVERAQLPKESGIYFVLEGALVRYVGRTNCLRQRWAAHHRFESYHRQEGLRIAWLTVSDTTLLPLIEDACIAFFHPRDNNTVIQHQIERVQQCTSSLRLDTAPVSIRLSIKARALLDALSAELGVSSRAAVMEMAIREMAKRVGVTAEEKGKE